MPASSLRGMRVAILANDGVEQAELVQPRQALEDAGAETVLIGPKSGQIQAMNHDEKADKFPVDQTLDQADPNKFRCRVASRRRPERGYAEGPAGRAEVRTSHRSLR
jgi:hypothetical protein